jgi:hypothetical protein
MKEEKVGRKHPKQMLERKDNEVVEWRRVARAQRSQPVPVPWTARFVGAVREGVVGGLPWRAILASPRLKRAGHRFPHCAFLSVPVPVRVGRHHRPDRQPSRALDVTRSVRPWSNQACIAVVSG